MSDTDLRAIPQLLNNALLHASDLFSEEVALAKAEVAEKATMLGRGVALIGFGALLVIPALVMILFAIAAYIVSSGYAPAVAYLLTGVGALIVGALIVSIGASRFSAKKLTPQTTLDSIRRDTSAVKEMAQ